MIGLNKATSEISLNINLLKLTLNRKLWSSYIRLREKPSFVQNQKFSASLKEKDGQRCHANSNQIKSCAAILT